MSQSQEETKGSIVSSNAGGIEETSVTQLEDFNVIEVGDVSNTEQSGITVFNRDQHEADTARKLAYTLVFSLAGFFVLHYVVILIAAANKWEVMDILQDVYNAGLPVLSGLTGAAATYFFTRKNNDASKSK